MGKKKKSDPKEEDIYSKVKVKGKGVFDLEDFYAELYRWFEHNGYDWHETRYKNVDMPNGAKMIEFVWKCDRKLNEYYGMKIDLYFQVIVSDVEVNVEGKKVKRQKGSLEVISDAKLVKHVEMFDKAIFKDQVQKAYEYMTQDTLDFHEDEATAEAIGLLDEIKAFVGMMSR